MKKRHLTEFLKSKNNMKFFSLFWVILVTIFFSDLVLSQEPYYFHTIHSHGLSFIGGRTGKINYMYQLSRSRQLKVSGTYIYDSYDQGMNHVKANSYVVNVQFQYNLINANHFFLNLSFGGGGYNLIAKDRLNIKHKEWRFNFVGGAQAELYVVKNTIALTIDYDILYMPWSKIYEFMHVPTAGITLFFF